MRMNKLIKYICFNESAIILLEDSAGQVTEMPSHENIRGKEYYQ